ncbi:MAG TPA: ribosome maturation factor RimP [Thermoanaerobaculia bacterium]|nr:ribosome maturation factor RimP [Thermoanaerobaculia bacterium]
MYHEEAVTEELGRIFAEIADSVGCELVHAELKGPILRLTIDRAGGITHRECELVSRQVSALLDVEDFGRSNYVLEVSSPGLDRRLYKPSDYGRFLGQKARVTTTDPASGHKATVVGTLRGYDPDAATVELEIETEPEKRVVPLATIQEARLVPEL